MPKEEIKINKRKINDINDNCLSLNKKIKLNETTNNQS